MCVRTRLPSSLPLADGGEGSGKGRQRRERGWRGRLTRHTHTPRKTKKTKKNNHNSAQWKKVTDAEKVKYNAAAEKDKARYQKELAAYNKSG